jgi:hypothetical protein
MEERTEKKQYKDVFSVLDRGPGRKPYWFRIGVAFPFDGGSSLSVKLDGFPKNGELVIRDHNDPPWERPGRPGEFPAALEDGS